MNTKLHLNLLQGIVEVEGEESFVRQIYYDYKDRLRDFSRASSSPDERPKTDEAKGNPKSKSTTRRSATQKPSKKRTDSEAKTPAYRPALDKDLDTSGLVDFYEQFSPKNNAEKILVLAKFLEENLDISPCNADQIYTCYRILKQPVPQYFRQVIINTSGRDYGFIEYGGIDDIKVSIIGQNHIDDGLARKGDE